METTDRNRIQEVFSMVQDKQNWKNPIDAVLLCASATREEISEAVIYFTGSVPTITNAQVMAQPHPDALVLMRFDAWHVVAAGYYAAVGA